MLKLRPLVCDELGALVATALSALKLLHNAELHCMHARACM